ncbi:SGNH/GDSL hydrolase family protein [Parasegetibacter sp. NRK P23]|uniref:SGNH/GDSL hydrolase family protein n=1 Tax=Parasegetibacter sp. NRK P23 TaxID=2942999 RepID=UPI0020430C77|nr:SGNH/GDSL hydrolase family protein [Parasegetibacter sp. NRK P23]MCM5529845.1 SGNH/GDSL hydrolase family protein [Parasegetibacter sp. NRK P23]
MKITIALFSTLLLLSFMPVQQKKRIVFFGDSITQAGANKGGYIQRIDSMLKSSGKSAGYELMGAGIGGNKIYDLYLRMEEDVLAKNPDIVVIWVGVNDVWHKRTSGTGTDPDKFLRFYNAVIKKLRDKNIKVVLCTPAAIGEKTDFTNELDGDLNKYASFIRDLAKKNDCGLIDLRKSFLDYNLKHNSENKESGILTTDRVHLNEKGNQFVAEEMMKVLF